MTVSPPGHHVGWSAVACTLRRGRLASASWQLLIAGGGSLVGRVLTGPRGRRVTALASSAIIAGLAVVTLLF